MAKRMLIDATHPEETRAVVLDDRYLVEYAGEELLGDVDADVASFLMEASCFERVSGEFCDDVLHRRGSAQLLEDLRRQNLLVIPLDDRREWYRFHHLMAEFLQSELALPAPDEPGPFSMADPDRTAALLRAAGYDEVSVAPITGERVVTKETSTMDIETLLEVGPLSDAFLAADESVRSATVDAVIEALSPFADGEVWRLPGRAWHLSAVRP